jgi:CheY-like chemotaxis protein
MVVDDEAAIVTLLKANFEAEDYQVVEAFDGASAIAKAMSEKPDVIILDINMPAMTGLEVCAKLKESVETKSIPIIVLSAYAQSTDVEKSLACGATAHMTKPFTLDAITAAVAQLLNPSKPVA